MFDVDAAAQLLVIGDNLAGCRQTEDPERSILRATIDAEVADPAELGHIHRLQQAIRIRVLQEGWYFLGRQEGYRGYSYKSNPTPGLWRVYTETPRGQILGRYQFNVASVEEPPAVVQEIK